MYIYTQHTQTYIHTQIYNQIFHFVYIIVKVRDHDDMFLCTKSIYEGDK